MPDEKNKLNLHKAPNIDIRQKVDENLDMIGGDRRQASVALSSPL